MAQPDIHLRSFFLVYSNRLKTGTSFEVVTGTEGDLASDKRVIQTQNT